MGKTTEIAWCHHTFSPWWGCSKVHAGCTHCYAEAWAKRTGHAVWGEAGRRRFFGSKHWAEPTKWARDAAKAGERRRVFCSSMCDVLEVLPEGHPDAGAMAAAREDLWTMIRRTASLESSGRSVGEAFEDADPARAAALRLESIRVGTWGLDWLILSKRPEHWRLIPEDVRGLVWLGTSISDQPTADEWVPRLLGADGFRLRFLSVEPQIGPVDLSLWLRCQRDYDGDGNCDRHPKGCPRIDWCICGGESGGKARPFDLRWARTLRDQCAAAAVPYFFKQAGADVIETIPTAMGAMGDHLMQRHYVDRKGGDLDELPADLRVRQFPKPHSQTMENT